MDKRDIPVSYDAPRHLNHCHPIGLLPRVQQAPALWQFLVMAHQALAKIPSQATLEGNPDIDVNLRDMAESTAKMYGVSIEEMFHPGLVTVAKLEANRTHKEWDSRINAWISSGGRAYNFLTRDPDKIGE